MLHRHDKELDGIVEELQSYDLFRNLDPKVVSALVGAGRVVHLPAQWALVTESQPADSCYVLLTGETEVRQHGEVIAQIHPGALIGEAAFVEHKTRNATVVTTGDVRALRVGFEELQAVFKTHPPLEKAFRDEWGRRAAGV